MFSTFPQSRSNSIRSRRRYSAPLLVLCLMLLSSIACGGERETAGPQAAQSMPTVTASRPAEPTVSTVQPVDDSHGSARGYLSAQGRHLLDSNGNRVRLRGVNLGGWLQWEGWIWGGGFNAETTILTRMEELVGADETARFQTAIYETFVSQADIAAIAEMGFNTVRVPINHRLLERDEAPFVYREEGWRILDSLLDWAEQYGIYVVLTLHSAPGGQSILFTADPEQSRTLWRSEENQDRTVALWRAIAERYRDRTIVAGYNLINEPDPTSDEALLTLYRRTIDGILEVDPNHLIFLDGSDYATDFSSFEEPLSSNQVYSFHTYTWFKDNRVEKLNTFSEISERHSVPLWNSEFGENNFDVLRSTLELFDEPSFEVAGWMFWTWKKVPNRFPGLVLIDPGEAWLEVIEWIELPVWPNEKPTPERAAQGIEEFLTAVQFSNNQVNAEMVELLTEGLTR